MQKQVGKAKFVQAFVLEVMERALTATKWYATMRITDMMPRLLAIRASVTSEIIVALGGARLLGF